MNSIYQKLLRKPRTIRSWSYTCMLFIFAHFFCLNVNAATYPVTNTNDAGAGSLRQAIMDANANAGADIIDATGISGTISLLTVLPNITESVTINGPGILLLTINQTIDRRVFTTNTGAINFVLQDLTLSFTGPGAVPYGGGGGAILTGGAGASTTIINVKFSNFRYQIGNGGAISQSSSLNTHNLTLTNCVFENNRAGGAGGAVSYNGLGTATITGCTFTGNVTGPVGANTGGDGGALSTTGGGNGGTYLVEKNTFIGNGVLNNTGHAGAVINTNGTLTLRFNRFTGNTCANVANPPLANVIAQTGGSTTNTTIADNNWWGVNTGPGANDAVALAAGATLTLTKWLQLKTTASPNPICATNPSHLGITSTVTTSFLSNSASEAIAVGNLPVLIGLPVTWGPTTLGSLSGSQANIQANGTATALFTSNGTGGNATVNTVVDQVPDNDATARATITVYTSPTVSTPINQIACAGSTAIFTATVTGMPAPTIQWYNGATLLENGVKYSGATTNTLSISDAQLSDVSANYHLVVSNACSTVISGNASLTVNIPSVAPTSISGVTTFCNPGTTTLTADGGTLGTGANYQWGTGAVVGTSPLVGETNATLTVSPIISTSYWVRIENTTAPCPANTSGVTQLVTVIQPSSAPSGISGTTTICSPGNTTLTADGGTLGTGANYQWGIGDVVGTSPLVGETSPSISVSPTSNTTYWVRIENTAGPCVTNTSGVTKEVLVFQPSTAPTSITGNTTICGPAVTTLTAVGGVLGTGANYQWGTGDVVGTSPLQGETGSSLTVLPSTITTYWVRIENTASPCTANTGGVTQLVTVNQPSSAPASISGTTTICSPGGTTLTAVGGTLGTGANYQWGTGGVVGTNPLVGETNATLTVSPSTSTTYWVRIENTTAPCTANTSGVTQLVTVNQPSSAPASISGTTTICSPGGTTLTAVGGTLGTGANYQWGTGGVVGTNPLVGETNATLVVSPSTSTTYWVRIENTTSPCTANTGGVTQLVTVNSAPVVTLDPQTQSVVPPNIVTFTAAASGNPTPTVKWQVSTGGAFTDIPNETSTTLSFATTAEQNGNQYQAVFSNICGSATTAPATLFTCTDPTISGPEDISLNNTTDLCGRIVSYSTIVGGMPAPQVTYEFTQATTASGSGDGSGSFFNVGITNVTITVTNACGSDSWSFKVTITDNQPPTITCPAAVTVKCAADVPPVNIATVTATDNCPGVITVEHVSDVITNGDCANRFTVTRTYKATDAAGISATCTQIITVNDDEGPAITGVSVSHPMLWPANHKMRDIQLNYTVADNCGGSTTTVVTVESNEDANGTGDGNTEPDWAWDPNYPNLIRIRAERAGNGDGRVYTITITSTDECGNSSFETTEVRVAHNITGPVSGRAFKIGSTVSFAGTFWDVPGSKHTARWVIDGSTTTTGRVTAEPAGSKNGTATGSYKFNSAGVYKLRMEITDQLGNVTYADANGPLDAIVVIYDPNGGYTYGGGSFQSPGGAFSANPQATGQVSYGFQNNYFKSATNPKGETQFSFIMGDFEFNALNYEYLAVDKHKAQFRGSGRITGAQSGISFIMTVIDGDVSGGGGTDKVRMKVFNKNTGQVYYDNQPGAGDADDPTMAVTTGSSVVIGGTESDGGGGGGKGRPKAAETTDTKLKLIVANNPSTGGTSYRIQVLSDDRSTPVNLRIVDYIGRSLENFQGIAPGSTIETGHNWTKGMYFAEAWQGNKRVVVKLIKL